MRGNRRGIALSNSLIVIAIVVILAFTISAVSLNHLNFSTRTSNLRQAQEIAESTISLCIAQIYADSTFGASRKTTDFIELRPPGGGLGQITFYPAGAQTGNLPYSTNNLGGTNPTSGSDPNTPVPTASAQLIAKATYNGVTRTVEATIYIPPFPYVIASAAPFRSTGNLLLGAVKSAAGLNSLGSLDPSTLVKANLASNASGTTALVIGPNSQITGDLVAVGQVVVDASDKIGGQIRPGSDAITIPKQDITSYDPQANNKPNLQLQSSGVFNQPTYQGFVKTTGNMAITNGLTLNNGVLYVDGNLSIGGGVKGAGAIFVTGTTTIAGGAELSTDNTLALLSKGDVTILGTDTASSYFQGMIYTEGSFTAQQMTLLGSFIQNGSNGVVSISDSQLISVPDYSNIQVTVNNPAPAANVSNSNILLKTDGNAATPGVYNNSGPIAFEAYPVTTGGWELVDPNTNTIYKAADLTGVTAQLKKILDAYHASKTAIIAEKNGQGGTTTLQIGGISNSNLTKALTAQLANVAPRAPGSPTIIPPPPGSGTPSGDTLNLSPSKFLSVKDQVRMLYWRVH